MGLDPLGVVLELPLTILVSSFRKKEEGSLGHRCEYLVSPVRRRRRRLHVDWISRRTSSKLCSPLRSHVRLANASVVFRDELRDP